MNAVEKEKIEQMDAYYRPLTAWNYFALTFLYNIPLIGFIAFIINLFAKKNINVRSFTRSYLCGIALIAILVILCVVLGGLSSAGGLSSIIEKIKAIFQSAE